jgi:hypothetical protein
VTIVSEVVIADGACVPLTTFLRRQGATDSLSGPATGHPENQSRRLARKLIIGTMFRFAVALTLAVASALAAALAKAKAKAKSLPGGKRR